MSPVTPSNTPAKADQAEAPVRNDKPLPPQQPEAPKGTGHQQAEGGLPEKQPARREQ